MKHFTQALICFSVLALVFFSCKKEYSYEVPGGGGQGGSYQWSFSEGTNAYNGPIDSAYIDTLGTVPRLNIAGHSSDKKDNISLQIFADTIKVGSYQTDRCSFDYFRTGIAVYRSDLTAIGQFTVSITAMDSVSITGTFNGTALDTGKVKKTITDGKFKVKFKSATGTPPVTTNCKPSILNYCDTVSGKPLYALTSLYNNFNTIKTIVAADSSSSPATVDNSFPISISTGKITVDAGGAQYFTVDANNRITGFVGYDDPTDNTSDPIKVSYTFDANGHLIDRLQAYTASTDTLETTYAWSGNLMTQSIVTYDRVKWAQVDYTYDPGKPVKNFLNLHPYAAELGVFQPAINAGVIPDQALVKAIETDYDYSTNPATSTVYSAILRNYNIGADKYVKSFQVTGDDYVAGILQAGVLYKLTYRCN